ncbi:MAG: class C sortase [Candidatus Ventricola sp.]
MKKHLSTIALVLVLLVGLSLMLYPTVSDRWNKAHQSRAIATYSQTVSGMENARYEELLAQAQAYNETLTNRPGRFVLTDEERAVYERVLDVSGTGIMGYIEIPRIGCSLPIYHGTSEGVLQIAVGHIEGSSLPTGGLGTHCVLSGHRGLPSAKLFTSLDRMEIGDPFMLHVLDETLTYEVDQILIVEPQDVSALNIDPQADLCTLVTCTPYGINSHRLLVRGHRIETVQEKAPVVVAADAVRVEGWKVAIAVAAPLMLAFVLAALLLPRRRG